MSKRSALIHKWSNWWHEWQQFWAVFHRLHRRDDLENLVTWAQRKKLAGQARHYSSLLSDTEIDLNRYALRQRNLTTRAHYLYALCRFLKPPRRFYPRGSAATYSKH